jgi:hypothetical protein
MFRFVWGAMIAAFAVAYVVAQSPATPLLKWPEVGKSLKYSVKYGTKQSFTQGENTGEYTSQVDVIREWKVIGLEANGQATLDMSITQMVMKRTNSSSDKPWEYDSTNPDKGTPEMRKEMEKHLNKTLATVTVDGFGQVVAVKNAPDATSFEMELPFLGVLPNAVLKPGMQWERPYKITLNPPLGTGEKYDAVQKFECKSIENGKAIVTFTTELKTKPAAAAEMIPLWQMLPAGELIWDTTAGQLLKGQLTVKESLKSAEGSITTYESVKVVELIK